jgi:hypothetical protein
LGGDFRGFLLRIRRLRDKDQKRDECNEFHDCQCRLEGRGRKGRCWREVSG